MENQKIDALEEQIFLHQIKVADELDEIRAQINAKWFLTKSFKLKLVTLIDELFAHSCQTTATMMQIRRDNINRGMPINADVRV